MAFTTKNIFPNVSRSSNAGRAAAELANAHSAYTLNGALSSAAIAIGTTTTKVKTAATLTYQINGAFFSKAATDDFWTLSGTVVASSRFQKYLLLIDSAGAASIQEGTQAISAATVLWTNVTAASAWGPLTSLCNAGKCVVGYITVATSSTVTFTPGTTALSAAGITTTYTNGIDQSLVPLIANEIGTIVGLGG